MWTDRRILDLFQVEHPILQAPMVGATGPELVAAVSAAGALGGLGAAGASSDELRRVVGAIRERTDRPVHVNLFDASTEHVDPAARPGPRLAGQLERYHRELDLGPVPDPRPLFGPAADQLETLLEMGVPVVSFHFGVGPEAVARAHDGGARVLSSATTVAEARILEDRGVDAIIAQGAEAGGHRGTFASTGGPPLVGTLALVPAVVDAVSVPVIAAGGIMDGRGLVACLALGAAGVQMGTAFLGCGEAPVPERWREALDAAQGEDTVVTSAWSGRPARGLRGRFVDEVEALGEPLLPYPAHYSLSRAIRRAAVAAQDTDFFPAWAGQGVGLSRRLSARELVERLVIEAGEVSPALSGSV